MGPWSEKRKTIEMALGMVFDGLPPRFLSAFHGKTLCVKLGTATGCCWRLEIAVLMKRDKKKPLEESRDHLRVPLGAFVVYVRYSSDTGMAGTFSINSTNSSPSRAAS